MKTGFWEDYEEYREEEGEADWAFLDGNDVDVVCDMNIGDEIFHRRYNAYDFLHGCCTAFAQYLNETYGYDIEIIYQRYDDEEDSSKTAQVVHAYCITPEGHYVDIRGVCDNWEEFIQDFIDTGLWDNDDYSFEQTYKEMPEDLKTSPDGSVYKAAIEMDKKYPGYYSCDMKKPTVVKNEYEDETEYDGIEV